jgi:hypothetical protein
MSAKMLASIFTSNADNSEKHGQVAPGNKKISHHKHTLAKAW